MTFILPNPMGGTIIQPGRPMQQYMVFPGPGQLAPNGARMAPTYQQIIPQYRPQYQPAPSFDWPTVGQWGDDADDGD